MRNLQIQKRLKNKFKKFELRQLGNTGLMYEHWFDTDYFRNIILARNFVKNLKSDNITNLATNSPQCREF